MIDLGLVSELTTLALRGGTGAFFAISGFHKLFVKARHATLVETLKTDGIRPLGFFQWFVPGVEFLAGLGVAFGFLTPLSALGLFTICIVATCTDAYRKVAGWGPIDRADVVDDYLYLPEVIYALILAHFVAAGGGRFSLDALILAHLL
jgi:uncharacterized membrane protein YphA (DoxX/SURF4 family)